MATARNTAQAWRVDYASAGCLPDESMVFESLEDAVEHVLESWLDVADSCDEWKDEQGHQSPATIDAIQAIRNIDGACGVDDPRPGSLYRWSIEPMDAEDVFAYLSDETPGIDSCEGESAYLADSVVDSYRMGATSRYSWHLLEPSHPGNESGDYMIRCIRERFEPCEYDSTQDSDDPVTKAHEGGFCSCMEPVGVDVSEVSIEDALSCGMLSLDWA